MSEGVWSGSVRNVEALMSYKVEKKVLLADKDALKQGSDPGKCKRTKTMCVKYNQLVTRMWRPGKGPRHVK